MQRPDWPRININAPLAGNLLFAGLGGGAGTLLMADASGYGNSGTLTLMDPPGDWLFDPTLNRWCLDFDGSDDYVVTGAIPMTYPMGFGCWFRSSSAVVYGRIIEKGANTELQIAWNGDKSAIGFYAGAAGGIERQLTSSACLDGVWHHIYGQANGTQGQLFLDGQPVADPSNANLTIGSGAINLGRSGGGGYLFTGRMADPVMYGRMLSTSEIQALADPSNVMLSGLIVPPKRELRPVAVAGGGISATATCTGSNGAVAAAGTVSVAATAAAAGSNGSTAAAGTVAVTAAAATTGTSGATVAAATVVVTATGAATGTNGSVAAAGTVTTGITATGAAVGSNGAVAAAGVVAIAASAACSGVNGSASAAATVAIAAEAVCVGANATVVARIGAAAYKPMMFMVC